MGVHDKFVEQVVHLQLTSPSFAEYCVAHATDPKHRFLFTDDGSSERRLYMHLMKEEERKIAAASRALLKSSGDVGPQTAQPRNGSSTHCNGGTTHLWSELLHFFSTAHSVRGPHMPHMFRTLSDLDAFLTMLDTFHHDQAAADGTVQYMLRRLPMTETFLYVLWYRCDELANHNHSAGRQGESADLNALQAAGSMLFIANVLLMDHRALPGKTNSYAPAFDLYLLKMVETLTRVAPAESTLAKFVRDTVAEWSVGGAVAAETLKRMVQLSSGTVEAK